MTDTEDGRDATSPRAIPLAGWKDIALRSWKEAGQDNISLVASGVAFCGVLAMVPMLGAVVLSYGLIATPETVMKNVQSMTAMMPADAARLIGEQLANIVTTSDGKKGFGLIVALGIALYGAMKGAAAMITSLNIAYDEDETRGFVALNLRALAITAGAVLLAILAILSIAAMGALEALFPSAPGIVLALGKIASYTVMAIVAAAAASTLYRYGPDRDVARWRWLTPGALLATALWLLVTVGFGLYVANFGSYDATYGSLGAAIVLLTWLYLSAYILLLGAEFNCELERQTARDTTHGAEQPMGVRGAFAADTVAFGDTPSAQAGPGPASDAVTPDPTTHPVRNYATARALTRILPGARLGTVPTILVTGGLTMLRRKGGMAAGVLLLAAGGGLGWLTRDRD